MRARLFDAQAVILNVLDLFSGIGGFSLGLERTGGFRTVAFCEVDKYCQRVLRKHWPDVPIHDDVRLLNAASLVERIDVVCGGFPCQDISTAGKGAGLNGARSGLWFEMFRIIAETRPSYVIVENVAALRSRGLDVVLGCLASIGYDAEWHCIPAAAVGAPHRRDRVWIVAYASGTGLSRPESVERPFITEIAPSAECYDRFADARRALAGNISDLRIGNGISLKPHKDRIKALGNSIVPQIAEQIGMAILYREALHA